MRDECSATVAPDKPPIPMGPSLSLGSPRGAFVNILQWLLRPLQMRAAQNQYLANQRHYLHVLIESKSGKQLPVCKMCVHFSISVNYELLFAATIHKCHLFIRNTHLDLHMVHILRSYHAAAGALERWEVTAYLELPFDIIVSKL